MFIMADQPVAKYRKDYTKPSHLISEIDLHFTLEDSNTTVVATSKVTQNAESDSLVLVGDQLKLLSVEVNGQVWETFSEQDGELSINELPKEFDLRLVTEIDPENNTSLEGLYKSDGAFCTQCEAEGFRRITYYLDRPDVLAIFTTTIVADKSKYPFLLSNGNRVDQGEAEDGKHWVKWNDPHPKPAYLFALVAGDFDVDRNVYVTKSGRKVDLEIYVDKGNLDRTPHAMTSLINSMRWDEERFNLEYDLDVYMIVAVDFFNMGAMENKGLNVFNSKFVLAKDETATDVDYLDIERVIGHEYFHNWSGNRVTCRDWFQLSLKEGLTVFRDQEFSSDLGSRAVNRIGNVRVVRGPQFAEDASPMSHPIRPEKVIEMNNFYTVTVYEKGSEVIRMMHTLLGEAKFQRGIALYFERHDGTAATCDDFVAAMQDASGVDLTLFKRWYSQSGTPTLAIQSNYDAEKKQYHLTVEQSTAPTHDQKEKLPLHIPLDIELYDSKGNALELVSNGSAVSNILNVTQASETFVFENIEEQPVPSLLREFSAPVKLIYDYSDAELIFLMTHATNEFARWDASQMLLAKYIKQNVIRLQQDEKFAVSPEMLDAFRGILLDPNLDPALIAEVFTLPSHNEVSGWYETVDIDNIATVLKLLKKAIASELADELLATYYANTQAEYNIEHSSIAKRSLRNTVLGYIAYLESGNDVTSKQYLTANNMTDSIAALTAINAAGLSCREALLDQFSNKWKSDGLVMDKWFILQGTNSKANALEVIKESMNHEAFSLKNPNRTRSLVGAFFNANPTKFHAIDGSGYKFAGEIIAKLNSSNPQIASRLIDPLLKFKKYDDVRQTLIREELEKLKALDNLANDLFEKVTKALES
jgi:aminopeptidase N